MKNYLKIATTAILSAALLAIGAGAANATAPQYTLVAWKITSTTSNHFATPQEFLGKTNSGLIDVSATSDDDLAALTGIKACNVKVQFDLYDPSVTFGVGSVLRRAGDGEIWPNGTDYNSTYSKVVTYGPCATPPTVVASEPPLLTDICTDEQGQSFTLLLPETVGVSYEAQIDEQLRRIRVVATATEGYVLASGEDKDVYHFEYTDEVCPIEPPVTEPPVPPTEPEPSVPPPSNELAETGLSDNPAGLWSLVAAAVLALAGGVLLVARARRTA